MPEKDKQPDNESLNILILHGYSGRNIGDAAIVKGTIEILREVLGPAEFSIASTEHSRDVDFIANNRFFEIFGCRIIPAFFPGPQCRFRKNQKISLPRQIFRFARGFVYSKWCELTCRILGRKASKLVGPAARQLIHSICDADIIISKGSGTFYGYGLRGELYLRRLFSFFALVKALGRKVGVYGITVGPFKGKRTRRLVSKSFSKLDLLFVREHISKEILQNLNITENVFVIPDLSFALAPEEMPEYTSENRPLRLALTVRNKDFRHHAQPELIKENLLQSLASSLDLLLDKYEAEIVFLPHSDIDNVYENDLNYMDTVREKMKHGRKILIRSQPESLEELLEIYKNVHFTIGMRLHSLVLSTAMRTPFIGILCEKPKMQGTLSLLGLEDAGINVEEITPEALLGKVDWVLRNHAAIRATQDKKVKEFKSILRNSAGTIADHFGVGISWGGSGYTH